jgi:hypothetical protein
LPEPKPSYIPTGAINEFPIDVTKEIKLEETKPVIDNCFVLKSTTDRSTIPLDTRQHPLSAPSIIPNLIYTKKS